MNASSKRIRLKTPTSIGFSFKQKYESTIIIAILALQQYFSRTLGAKKGENYVEVGVRRAVAMHKGTCVHDSFYSPSIGLLREFLNF